MNSIYLLANSFDRFHSELGICSKASKTCKECGYPIFNATESVSFYWDKMFGDVGRSIREEHEVFWAEFSMLVTSRCAGILDSLRLPITIENGICLSQVEAQKRFEIESENITLPLFWIKPYLLINLKPEKFRICALCDGFADSAWKINGLNVPGEALSQHGLFGLKQNRGHQIFVTEETKRRLLESRIRGFGFFKAGTVV
jgi:hypothetical protein